MKLYKKVLLFGLFFILFQHLSAQNEKFKALFMYNFTKYLEWPDDYRQGDFVIIVLGETALIDELKIIAEKKKVGFQPIVVKKIASTDQISKCHMIYISKSKSDNIADVKEKLTTSSTVIIADNPGAISKGAGINYVVNGGKQLFEISKSNVEKQNIKVGADLLSLGIQK
ncbi:MAG: hypothetical protein A2X13_12520 [Bacteroidetes bacterium GWC2_33_15]|nr:MAG: hypothetical protein A2X10_14175 [Bacteroidetes bacterium GWA2_33_15]OFX50614.1 MAG: hypothetical protein A2X13_12520 [Bacteroidetes bacterium GWC2_33_15]OFX64151.1 MAG: hypothetical protein A2X15_02970 [Bacteroidetes bacterium GWB2_32_14]OFX69763.1 MAG: hypothetical protein A2X14_05195 [Bacteroidetes bacterium GWD2_33_33]HAN19800.1 DUF4154 domain-containing protein [Bacteroidales bacterium]